MEKSPEAFRTISEVAEWLGTPAHVLRFWESRFSQVKPVKRAGGRRYYRPSDMALLGGIKKLLHEDGMTIRGVQKLLREEGVRYVASLSPPLNPDEEAIEGTAREIADAPRPPEPPRPAPPVSRTETGEIPPKAEEPSLEAPAAPAAPQDGEAPMQLDVPPATPENVVPLARAAAKEEPAPPPDPEPGAQPAPEPAAPAAPQPLGEDIPEDPPDDIEMPDIPSLPALLRQAARRPAGSRPSPEALAPLHQRLTKLRQRMNVPFGTPRQ